MKCETMTGEELGRQLLESVRQMKAGQGRVVYSPQLEGHSAQSTRSDPLHQKISKVSRHQELRPRLAKASPKA